MKQAIFSVLLAAFICVSTAFIGCGNPQSSNTSANVTLRSNTDCTKIEVFDLVDKTIPLKSIECKDKMAAVGSLPVGNYTTKVYDTNLVGQPNFEVRPCNTTNASANDAGTTTDAGSCNQTIDILIQGIGGSVDNPETTLKNTLSVSTQSLDALKKAKDDYKKETSATTPDAAKVKTAQEAYEKAYENAKADKVTLSDAIRKSGLPADNATVKSAGTTLAELELEVKRYPVVVGIETTKAETEAAKLLQDALQKSLNEFNTSFISDEKVTSAISVAEKGLGKLNDAIEKLNSARSKLPADEKVETPAANAQMTESEKISTDLTALIKQAKARVAQLKGTGSVLVSCFDPSTSNGDLVSCSVSEEETARSDLKGVTTTSNKEVLIRGLKVGKVYNFIGKATGYKEGIAPFKVNSADSERKSPEKLRIPIQK